MKEYPYFPCYIAEALLDTAGMDRAEVGDYFISLIRSWKKMDAGAMPDWLAECAESSISKSRILSDNAKARWEKSKQKKAIPDANVMQLHNKCNANAMQKRREEKIGEEKIGELKTLSELLAESIANFNRCFPAYAYNPKSKTVIKLLSQKVSARSKSFEGMNRIIETESGFELEDFVLDGSWFSFAWLMKSDSNFEKFANGNYRKKDSKNNRVADFERMTQEAIDGLANTNQY